MLECRRLTVRFGSVTALGGVDLSLTTGTVGAVIGPSGSGKSTLLRTIAGLEHPGAGTVHWNGVDLTGVAAHQRGFGLMFQDYALFPHLDVGSNVGFALEVAGAEPDAISTRVADLLELVGLAGLEGRPVEGLSGGEQQRVALARTLAPAPVLLMLDEPLGALDRTLRDELLPEMRRIFGALGTSVLYVTHDHDEAFAVADEVFVMRSGVLVGHGAPEQLWKAPPDLDTARFFGFDPVMPAEVSDGKARLDVGTVAVDVPDGRYVAALAPLTARLDPAGEPAAVVDSQYTTTGHLVTIEIRGHQLDLRTSDAATPGTTVPVSLDPERVTLYAEERPPSNSSV